MSDRPTMEELSAYLDGDLEAPVQERVRQAIAEDPALQAELQSLEQSRKLLKDYGRLSAPPDLKDAVLNAVANEPLNARSDWSRTTTGAIILAAAAATLLVLLPSVNVSEQGVATSPEPQAHTQARPKAPAAASSVSASRSLSAKAAALEEEEDAFEEEALSNHADAADGEAPPSPPPAATTGNDAAKSDARVSRLDQPYENGNLGGIAGGVVGSERAMGSAGFTSRGGGAPRNTASELSEPVAADAPARAPSGPTLSSSRPTIQGQLDKALVVEVFTKHESQLRGCYLTALEQEPNLAGKLTVGLVITNTGTVSSATINGSTLGNAPIEACLVKHFMRMAFPQPRDSQDVTVTYPLAFSPR